MVLTAQHVIVGVICYGIYMGWGLRAALSLVSSNHGSCVDGEPFVGVDGDTEEARVCLKRECTGGLSEAKFPSPGSRPHKTTTLAIFPKDPLKAMPYQLWLSLPHPSPQSSPHPMAPPNSATPASSLAHPVLLTLPGSAQLGPSPPLSPTNPPSLPGP